MEKVAKNGLCTFVIKKQSNVNIRPIRENSPKLVTLVISVHRCLLNSFHEVGYKNKVTFRHLESPT
jgi:hypothetical protein